MTKYTLFNKKDKRAFKWPAHETWTFDTKEEAEVIAKQCVASTQGGSVIPKIYQLEDGKLKETMKSMHKLFDRIADDLYKNEEVSTRK